MTYIRHKLLRALTAMNAGVWSNIRRFHIGTSRTGGRILGPDPFLPKRLRAVGALTLLGTCLAAMPLAAAPPKPTRLIPAGATRGQTATFTLAGEFDPWPVQCWTDRPGVEVVPEKTKGQVRIAVDAAAPPGVCCLRFYNREGAAPLRPLLINLLTGLPEKEPNDNLKNAQPVETPAIVQGALAKSGDVDVVAVSLKAGQTLVAAMTANRLIGSPMDATLQVCSADGFVLERNDDCRGLDPQIVFTAPADGQYCVRTFAFPERPNSSIAFSGGPTFIYQLTLTTAGFVDRAFPLAVSKTKPTEVSLSGWSLPDSSMLKVEVPTDSSHTTLFHAAAGGWLDVPVVEGNVLVANESTDGAETPLAVELPATITGRIDQAGDVDSFRFAGKKGQSLEIRAESLSLGYPLDAVLQLNGPDGQQIVEVDDSRTSRDPELMRALPVDGEYTVALFDAAGLGGERYVYRLSIAEAKADFSLGLSAGEFVVKPGGSVEIPINVTRLKGFAGEINVRAADLPAGVSAEVVTSSGKGATAKAVKLVLKADGKAAAHSGVIRISGASVGEPELTRPATFSVPGLTRPHASVWLTVVSPETE